MSQATPATSQAPTEKTFRGYSQEQSRTYARLRRGYSDTVYDAVINYHTSSGGQLGTVVDVGCGPGLATFALAPIFGHVVGLDQSEAMIATARSKGVVTHTGEPLRFETSSAETLGEDLSPPITESSVDLITAAEAAHWFNMPRFWTSAARVLRPGGSVALWSGGGVRAHPSNPNPAAIQAALDEYHQEHLRPYEEPGNVIAHNRYIDLPLPWTVTPPVTAFDKDSFVRKEWGVGEDFFAGFQGSDLATFERALATASPVTRWREAHPDDVGTDRDVVKMLRLKLAQILREAGLDPETAILKGDVQGVLLMVKKSG